MALLLHVSRTIEGWPYYGPLALSPSAALSADKKSVASAEKTSVESRAKTSVAAAEETPDISMSSTTPWGLAPMAPPQGAVDFLQMPGVSSAAATDMLALDTSDVLAAIRARLKVERRRPNADFKCDFGLDVFRRPV